jgi:hypothetical protein
MPGTRQRGGALGAQLAKLGDLERHRDPIERIERLLVERGAK